jgi:hypothetical protein
MQNAARAQTAIKLANASGPGKVSGPKRRQHALREVLVMNSQGRAPSTERISSAVSPWGRSDCTACIDLRDRVRNSAGPRAAEAGTGLA